jgi:hypothetical protein
LLRNLYTYACHFRNTLKAIQNFEAPSDAPFLTVSKIDKKNQKKTGNILGFGQG